MLAFFVPQMSEKQCLLLFPINCNISVWSIITSAWPTNVGKLLCFSKRRGISFPYLINEEANAARLIGQPKITHVPWSEFPSRSVT